MRNYLKGALTVIVVVLIVTFAIKNNQAVQLNYYFNTLNIQLPAYALVFLNLFIGILLGIFIGWYRSLSLKRQLKQLKHNQFANSTEYQHREEA